MLAAKIVTSNFQLMINGDPLFDRLVRVSSRHSTLKFLDGSSRPEPVIRRFRHCFEQVPVHWVANRWAGLRL